MGECEDQGEGGRGQGAGGAGEANEEILALPISHFPFPIPHTNIYWAQMLTSCVNYLNIVCFSFSGAKVP